MPQLTTTQRAAIGTGLQHSMEQMGHIVKIVTSDPNGGSPGWGPRANVVFPPGSDPIYTRLFVDLQKILHEIETELLKGWRVQPPVPPLKQG